ncbi:hypothetical protein BUALT_Bualt19G0121900 [Buddleja alternifolia]|uniref:Chromo domain-containing protein n=1 Tax=Buddleja alternifolia TaxID=168488 RepID=A0AAV6W2W8_9LAMI|nr:hypothetical protein BUALT_Bualt19G0121900 [Buddleja alternifolia]
MLDGLDDASIEIKEVNVCFEISLPIVEQLLASIPVEREDDPMFVMSMEGVLLSTITRTVDARVCYDDAACVLRKMVFDAKDPHLSSTTPPILPGRLLGTVGQSQGLRCLIAIIRLLYNFVICFLNSKLMALPTPIGDAQQENCFERSRQSLSESDSEAEVVEHAEKLCQVKAILDEFITSGTKAVQRSGLQENPVQICWKGYGSAEDTWEPIESLSTCQEKLKEFVSRDYATKMLPISWSEEKRKSSPETVVCTVAWYSLRAPSPTAPLSTALTPHAASHTFVSTVFLFANSMSAMLLDQSGVITVTTPSTYPHRCGHSQQKP